VYEHTPVEYYLVDFTGPVRVSRQEKEIRTETRETGGVINVSLWMSTKELGLDPLLAIELSEIYAWTIDFFAIQKGDSFKVIYDELYVDTVYTGMGKIHGHGFIMMQRIYTPCHLYRTALNPISTRMGTA